MRAKAKECQLCVAPPLQWERKETADGSLPATVPQEQGAQSPGRDTSENWEEQITASLYETLNSTPDGQFFTIKIFLM